MKVTTTLHFRLPIFVQREEMILPGTPGSALVDVILD